MIEAAGRPAPTREAIPGLRDHMAEVQHRIAALMR
jgi:hypothetical protein